MAYITAGDFNKALQAGKQGAITGLIGGSVSSFASYAVSRNAKMQPERMEMKESRMPQSADEVELKGGDHSVYVGYDDEGIPRYVGRTGRDPGVRWSEHKSALDGKSNLDFRIHSDNLNLDQSRVIEQNLMNQYGIPKYKSGGTLIYNQRNSIAPKYWPIFGVKP